MGARSPAPDTLPIPKRAPEEITEENLDLEPSTALFAEGRRDGSAPFGGGSEPDEVFVVLCSHEVSLPRAHQERPRVIDEVVRRGEQAAPAHDRRQVGGNERCRGLRASDRGQQVGGLEDAAPLSQRGVASPQLPVRAVEPVAWRGASAAEKAAVRAEFKASFDRNARAPAGEPAPRWKGPIKVQSVLVPKSHCPTEASARAWAKANDFKFGRIEEQANFWRLVQAPSCACSRGTIRTTTFSEKKNIKATVCLPRRGVPFTLSSPCKAGSRR